MKLSKMADQMGRLPRWRPDVTSEGQISIIDIYGLHLEVWNEIINLTFAFEVHPDQPKFN